MTQPQVPARITLAALFSAWLVDFLFYGKPVGVSILAWFVLTLAAGFILARMEHIRPAYESLLLGGMIVLFAAVPLVRAEPFTAFTSTLLALGLLIVLAATFRTGFWTSFRLWDYLTAALEVGINAIVRPLTRPKAAAAAEGAEPAAENRPSFGTVWRRLRPILLGLALALPVVLMLNGLLTSADPIFAARMDEMFSFLKIERLPEYLFRLIYILILAFLFSGVLLHALFPTRSSTRPDADQRVLNPFLGFTETMIVLGAVVLLFAVFVTIQFQYLFGGQANITATGFTYAEYARRGFNELVGVAVLSLGLYLALDAVAQRETPLRARIFRASAAVLLALVLVILSSALMRLMLYQQAYGLTRLRLQTLIFIPWLGALLLAAVALILWNVKGRMGLAFLTAAVGFCLTLTLVNMDATIVRYNLQRAQAGEELDSWYFIQLSPDAVPAMVDGYLNGALPPAQQQGLGAALACRTAFFEQEAAAEDQPRPWQGFNLSYNRAQQALTANAAAWAAYPVSQEEGYYQVKTGAGWQSCYPDSLYMD